MENPIESYRKKVNDFLTKKCELCGWPLWIHEDADIKTHSTEEGLTFEFTGKCPPVKL